MVERALRRNPVTLAVLLLAVAGAVVGRGFRGPGPVIRFALGTGYEQVVDAHRWWTPITSVFVTDGGIELPVVLVGIVLVIGAAERLMGPARIALAFVVTAVAGAVVGIVVQQVGYVFGELWSRRVSELVTFDPETAIAGTILTASAFAGPLWRRRIRVLTFGIAAVFLLYSGQPSDLYRMIACLAGLALGVVLSPGEGPLHWQRSSHHETRVLLSAIVAITAIGPSITVFSRLRLGALAPLGLLLTDARPGGIPTVDECHAASITRSCLHDMTLERISGAGPVLVTVLPMLTLLVAALGILLGRRFAAILAIVVNVALAGLAAWFYGFLPVSGERWVLQFRTPHYWEVSLALSVSVLLPLAISVLLFANLRHVTVRASRAAIRTYLAAIGISFVGLSAFYLGSGMLVAGGYHPRVGFLDLLVDLPEGFVPIGFVRIERLEFLPTDPLTSFAYYWIGPIFWLVVIAGALVVVLTRGSRAFAVGRARVRTLLRQGAGSLSYWSTWEGNDYWFSADGRVAVAYRVIGGVAITSSEPIGEREASIAALGDFARFCDDNGWTPVFYSIHEEWRQACEALGWSSMNVGDETVILPGEWQTTGKRWQDVRSSINRAERAGVHSVWTSYGALSASHLIQLGEISEAWVAQKDLPEMGFTLGGVDELRDPDVMLMLAVDAEDRVLGITSWLPGWRDGRVVGWTLDFMRRTPDGMNGVMEFLIARCAEQFRAQGIEWMSLSAAPLASGGASTPSRLLGYIGARLEPVYGFRSLFTFKRKFDPQLLPLSMAYPDPLALPAIGVALARAYVPSLSVRQSIRFVRSLGQ
ncbi:MAG: Lysyl-tRNA synthetase [Microbacteriaceae bacterium]|nr:Lysyl-tRNA synthetase [Microbacteriaceae bacterium]